MHHTHHQSSLGFPRSTNVGHLRVLIGSPVRDQQSLDLFRNHFQASAIQPTLYPPQTLRAAIRHLFFERPFFALEYHPPVSQIMIRLPPEFRRNQILVIIFHTRIRGVSKKYPTCVHISTLMLFFVIRTVASFEVFPI